MIRHATLTIANGASASASVYVTDELFCGVYCPAALDGNLSVETLHPISGNWVTAKSLTFSANAYLPLTKDDFNGVKTIRLKTSSNQTADRSFVVSMRE